MRESQDLSQRLRTKRLWFGNVTNHFFIRANEVVAGDWEIRYSADMSEIHVYPEPASDTDTGNGGNNDTGGTNL